VFQKHKRAARTQHKQRVASSLKLRFIGSRVYGVSPKLALLVISCSVGLVSLRSARVAVWEECAVVRDAERLSSALIAFTVASVARQTHFEAVYTANENQVKYVTESSPAATQMTRKELARPCPNKAGGLAQRIVLSTPIYIYIYIYMYIS